MSRFNEFFWGGKYAKYNELCYVNTDEDRVSIYVKGCDVVVRSALKDAIYVGTVEDMYKICLMLTSACHDWGVYYNNKMIATIPGVYAKRELPPFYNAPDATVFRLDVSDDVKSQINFACTVFRAYADGGCNQKYHVIRGEKMSAI